MGLISNVLFLEGGGGGIVEMRFIFWSFNERRIVAQNQNDVI